MTSTHNPITEGNLWKALLYFFIPILFSSVVQQSYNIVDALIVGNYAGKEALAAVDSTYVIIKLLINVFISVAAGGSIVIAQSYGAGDREKVSGTVMTLIVFSVSGGLLITLIGTLMTPMLVSLMKVPIDIFDKSVLYLRIYFFGSLFSLMFNINSGVLRAIGDSKRPFFYMIVSSLLNIVLDVVFVAVLKKGIAGVACATVISQMTAAFLICRHMLGSKECYSLQLQRNLYENKLLKLILITGIPMGVQTLLYAISNIYMQRGINSYGTDRIAGWAICGKMDFLIWAIVDTMGITVMTFVAQNFGAGKPYRMKKVLHYAFFITIVFIGFISSILYFHGGKIAGLFNRDEQVLITVSQIMKRIAPYYVLYIGGELLSGAIRGRGETFYPMILTLLGTCLCRIVWIKWIVPLSPSFYLVMWGYPTSWFVTLILFSGYYAYFMYGLKAKHILLDSDG